MSARISTASQYQKFNKDASLLQSNIAKASDKINGKIENFSSLGKKGQIENYLNIKKSLKDIDSSLINNTIIEGRLVTMDKAVENIVDLATEIKKNFTLRNSSVVKSFNLKQIAISTLENIKNNLNSQYEGRYLFAGSKIHDKPVKDLSRSNLMNNVVTSNYYLGDNYIFDAQVSNNFKMNYGITAADQAFQDLIGSIHHMINLNFGAAITVVSQAGDLLDKSINELIQLRSHIGDNLGIIQNFNEENNDMRSYFRQKESEILPVDPTDAIIKLSEDRTALEALYKSFSIISKLTITNYL